MSGIRTGGRVVASLGIAFVSASCGSTPVEPTLPSSVSIVGVPSTPVISGITQIALQAAVAGSPDASLTYAWNFGDGSTATGATVSHVFPRPGAFPVQITVTNSRGASVSATASVDARSLAGDWELGFFVNFCYRIRLTHAGSTISMVTTNGSAIAASVSHPRNITLSIAAASNFNCGALQNASGSFDATLDSFTVGGFGGVNQTETWRRLPN
jgi:hypothetical protein